MSMLFRQKKTKPLNLRYLPSVAVVLLCFYFGYHLVQGERSVLTYFANMEVLEQKQKLFEEASQTAQSIRENNVRLRVATLDQDYLIERGRAMLGYAAKDEIIFLQE